MSEQDLTATAGVLSVLALQFRRGNARNNRVSVVVEDSLLVKVEGVGTYNLMWTPTSSLDLRAAANPDDGLLEDQESADALALAVGFLHGEGLIQAPSDLKSIGWCPDDHRVMTVQLASPESVHPRRHQATILSSCGFCGEIDAELDHTLPRLRDDLRVSAEKIQLLIDEMRVRQCVFDRTGGTHAAAIFTPAHEIVAIGEDLGRHNALDKVIGHCVLSGIDLGRCGVVLSSRLSFEMVLKAARAGLQIVGAVSAPTSMAIDMAKQVDMTLCGFVRSGECTTYAGEFRIGTTI